jgi:hypothetical protein
LKGALKWEFYRSEKPYFEEKVRGMYNGPLNEPLQNL